MVYQVVKIEPPFIVEVVDLLKALGWKSDRLVVGMPEVHEAVDVGLGTIPA